MCLSANSLQQPVYNNLQSNQRNVTLANGNLKMASVVMRIQKNQQQLNFALVKRMKLTITRSCKTYVEEKLVLRTTNSLVMLPETCEFNSVNCSLKPVNSTASTAAVIHNYWESGLYFHFLLLHKTNKFLQHFRSMIVLKTTKDWWEWHNNWQ